MGCDQIVLHAVCSGGKSGAHTGYEGPLSVQRPTRRVPVKPTEVNHTTCWNLLGEILKSEMKLKTGDTRIPETTRSQSTNAYGLFWRVSYSEICEKLKMKTIQFIYSLQVASVKPSHTSSVTQSNSFKNNLHATKNIAIVIDFSIGSWVPFLLLNFVKTFHPLFYANHGPIQTLHLFLFGLYLANSAVNPIIYGVRYREFNMALRLMFGYISEDGRHAVLESVTSKYGVHDDVMVGKRFPHKQTVAYWKFIAWGRPHTM